MTTKVEKNSPIFSPVARRAVMKISMKTWISMISSKLSRTRSIRSPIKVRNHREVSSVILFLVEDRQENSRQRLRRTIAELEQQKRLLKSQLQRRIHLWSENFKRPNFIRTRDKISFSIGVANACFSPLIGIGDARLLALIFFL